MRLRVRVAACVGAMLGTMWMALPGAAWAQYGYVTADVGFEGRVNWTEEDLRLAEVEAKFRELAKGDARIQITAQKDSDYKDVVPVISAALGAGLEVYLMPAELRVKPAMLVDEAAAKPTTSALRIFVDFDGALYWQGEVVDLEKLKANVAAAEKRDSKAEVWVEPHRLARFTAVGEVLMVLNYAGMTNLRIVRP
jgi:biopolymer transport protein ExbD